MQNLESILKIETLKLLWDVQIQTDNLISIKITRSCHNQQEKRTFQIVDFHVSADHRVELKESEKKDQFLDITRGLKKHWNMKVTVIPIVTGALFTATKRINACTKGLGNNKKGEGYPNRSIDRDRPQYGGESRRLVVTQTPVRNHRLTLVGKTRKVVIIKNLFTAFTNHREN